MKKLLLTSLAAAASLAALSSSATAQTAYGLNSGGLSFSTFDVFSPTAFSLPTAITGLQTGETITSIDFRPTSTFPTLYGFSSANRLYTIALGGAATVDAAYGTTIAPTPTAGTTAAGSNIISSQTAPQPVVIDVNPNVPAGGTTGALRIVSSNGNNLRYAFSNSTLNLDDVLTYSTGGTPQVVGVAYTNSDFNAGTGTGLFYLDTVTDSLYTTSLPNDGVLTLVGTAGALGINLGTTGVGFDVPVDGGAATGFASANGNFYRVNLADGTSTLVGALGGSITDIAVVPEPSTYVMLSVAGLGLLVWGKRRKLAVARS